MAYATWSVVFGEQPSASKWNILGTNDAWFNSLISQSSSHTVIGTNAVRATRYVSLSPAVQLVDTDPANTNWTAVDVTANTSANCYAIDINCAVSSSTTAGRAIYIRPTGSAYSADNTTLASAEVSTNGAKVWNQITTTVDSSQSFDWSVSNADVNAVTIVIRGYYEYVD